MKKIISCVSLLLVICVMLCGCFGEKANDISSSGQDYIASVNDVPAFDDEPYVEIKGNEPDFSESELVSEAYESYSALDVLGRCGVAVACISTELMPTEERGSIGQVKPSGWKTVKYDIVDGKYLYNRCHLIGYQLTGENANKSNLITGTRYMNVEGMLPFENMVADYIKETENHVLYRVTPVYDGDNLVARGVQLEAKSVEDGGEGICFNVYVYNNQPGIVINYATGDSALEGEELPDGGTVSDTTASAANEYILNINSKKFHLPDCSGAADISEKNKESYTGDRETLIALGYSPCKTCEP